MTEKTDKLKTSRFAFLRPLVSYGALKGEAQVKPVKPPMTIKRFVMAVAYRLFRLSGEFVSIVLGVALIWSYLMNVVLARKVVDISILKPNAALWFSEAFDGQAADLEAMYLRWQPGDNTLSFQAQNIAIQNKFRVPLESIERFQIEYDYDRVLVGDFVPRAVKTQGGAVTWLRSQDGTSRIGLGTPDSIDAFSISLPEQVAGGGSESPRKFSLGPLNRLEVKDARVFLRDEMSDLSLTFDNTQLLMQKVDAGFQGSLEASIIREDVLARVSSEASFSSDYEDFDLIFSANDLNLTQLSPFQGEYLDRVNLNIPLQIDLALKARRGMGLSYASLDMEAREGQIMLAGFNETVSKFVANANYDVETQALLFETLEVDTARHRLSGRASLSNIGSPASGLFQDRVDLSLNLADARIDASEYFDAPFNIKSFVMQGQAKLPTRTLELETLSVDFPTFGITTSLNLELSDTLRPTRLAGAGQVVGAITGPDLISIWPTEFATGARRWIDGSIKAGDVKDLIFRFDIPPSVFSGEPLSNDDLRVDFNVTDAEVQYIRTMTPYTNVSGSGTLYGNSFEATTRSGQVGDLRVLEGRVVIPKLNPHGGDFTIDIMAEGQVKDMMVLIDQKPFEFPTRYGVDPQEFAGEGRMDVTITRPLLEHFDQSRIRYEVSGDLTNVTAPFSVGDYALTQGDVALRAGKDGMQVTGPVNIGPWRADLDWRENFSGQPGSTTYNVKGVIDRDTLDGLGIGLREYLGGDIAIEVNAVGQGLSVNGATLGADLTQADLNLGGYWSKDIGIPGSISARIDRSDKGAISLSGVSMSAPELEIAGDIAFAEDFRLLKFDLKKADIAGFVDASLTVAPNADRSAFDVVLAGDYLDVSPFISNALTTQSAGVMLPLMLDADMSRLSLSDTFILREARLDLDHDGSQVRSAFIGGQSPEGTFTARIKPDEAEDRRRLTIDIPNASNAAEAFLSLDNIRGGRLQVDVTLPPLGELGAMRGTVNVEDFTLVRAPVLAQMLSLASLQGLADTMGGAGLTFTELNVPFSYEGQKLAVRDATAGGPALGLTGSGDIDIGDQTVDFDGVLVPAYTTNSVLADIPVVGDIFVGKKGEGIFALNYSVVGPFERTQVAVNPLSALTPGFLRRIFDTERKTLEEMKEVPIPENEMPTGDDTRSGSGQIVPIPENEVEPADAVSAPKEETTRQPDE